jgi:hypothetical protein
MLTSELGLLLTPLLELIASGKVTGCEIELIKRDIERAEVQGASERIRIHCEQASDRVKAWPMWKQNILKHSSESRVSISRKPIYDD